MRVLAAIVLLAVLVLAVAQPAAAADERAKDGAQTGSSATAGRAIHLKADDSGKTIAAAVGDLVIVELESNPTTGFSWAAEPELKSRVLELKSKDYRTFSQLNPEVRPMVGQGGIATFTYRATGTGKATISLAYRRSWEKEVAPARKFTATIEAARKVSPTVTGKIVFGQPPELEKISRVVVSIRYTAVADGPTPLVGTVELKPPLKLPITFAIPYDPAKVQPNPMFYSLSARVYTLVDGAEKLYYINDTHHGIFEKADDTKRDVEVKKVR